MTISKGQEWGTLAVPGPGLRTVDTDAELRELVIEARRSGRALPVVGLLGGDMMRTLGGTADPARFSGDEPIPHLPIDIVSLSLDDGPETVFVAHLVARGRTWWRGPLTGAMNAQFIGRVDVVTASGDLGLQQRWMASRRLLLGTHVPHPLISVKQHTTVAIDLGRPRRIWLDGQRWGSARRLQLTVEPDALVVCV